jgi:hypothetical protein
MPAFFESGSSNVSDVLGGDPDLQADALWAYFTLGESAPEPEGLTPQGGYRIKVGARPMVLRAFLKEAGSRGIAVGYPEAMGGIHFAFDAERVRLVDAWKGDFLDASGSWAGRGGSTVGGQGPRYWTAPPGPAIVIASERPAQWPSASGREAGTGAAGVNVTERFEPRPEGAITRTFEISPAPEGAKIWINAGPNSRVTSTSANATMAGAPETGIIGIVAKNDSMPVVVTIEAKP